MEARDFKLGVDTRGSSRSEGVLGVRRGTGVLTGAGVTVAWRESEGARLADLEEGADGVLAVDVVVAAVVPRESRIKSSDKSLFGEGRGFGDRAAAAGDR